MAAIARFLLALSSAFIVTGGAAQAFEEPPGRVGRLVIDSGSVMLHNADYPEWVETSHNWPLTSGDTLYSGRDTRAEVRIGSSVLRMDADTELRIERLDDERIMVRLDAGSLAVRVRSNDPEDAVVVETPDGSAVASEPGSFLIERAAMMTTVTANSGRLEFHAPDRQFSIVAGQRVDVWNAGHTELRIGSPRHDAFTSWVMTRESREDGLPVPAGVSREMIGVEELSAHGHWTHYPQYGPVWYPRSVSPGWAPYRSGRWIRVSPWGWTWLDEKPWGFAPFHYGRWAHINGRWGWVPGAYMARPVYAPALVAWVGSPGWSVSFSFGSAPAIGWFPLGPHEIFLPAYRASPVYIRRINIVHVTNERYITKVIRSPREARYAHRSRSGAVTVVPARVVSHGRPVRSEALRDSGRWMNDRLEVASSPRITPARRDVRAADGAVQRPPTSRFTSPTPAAPRQASAQREEPRRTVTGGRDRPQRADDERRVVERRGVSPRPETVRPDGFVVERDPRRQTIAVPTERRASAPSRRTEASQPPRVSTPTESIDSSPREIRESAIRSRTATTPPRTSDPSRSVRGAGRTEAYESARTTTPRFDARAARDSTTVRRGGPPRNESRRDAEPRRGGGESWGARARGG